MMAGAHPESVGGVSLNTKLVNAMRRVAEIKGWTARPVTTELGLGREVRVLYRKNTSANFR